ncbi:DNA cytosine methyltransferase [Blastococcus sp. VKM Ac-2987]|uniref:DNA cytosine methyltransferase n=1 Tax=Blastococcus sp. VKM Ac-2987 TaxID=3004141 RepID=UPI0022AB545E|nr:DNA cytosine methyltransferase [Blastococcus sp. VKM Ac-2987]MCZ2859988.1 DNA cytosine methyltransferase [Blastococcus sp. VKM Ac-2987]
MQPFRSSSDPAGDDKGRHLATVLDLFSGAGGMTQGFHASEAFRTVQAVEMDPQAAASYKATFGDAVVHVRAISDWLANCDVPSVDVVVGGPPCQGFSTLGKQDAEDERNALWHDYALTIVRAEPRYFVLENVGAFLKSRQFADLRAATEPGGLLADYDFEAGVLNAADFGAAQARRRTILIGHHRELPAPGLPAPTHLGRHVTLRSVLDRVPRQVETTDLPPDRWTVVQGRRVPGPFRTSELHVGRTYTELSERRFRSIPAGGNRFDIPEQLLSPCWVKHKAGSADVMGRLSWDKPSVTIRTEFFKPEKGRYLHPDEHRALTHLEAALIQGFPDSHRWVGSKTSIARQIGNAVPIPLGRAIAAHLSQAMTRTTADDLIDLAVPVAV